MKKLDEIMKKNNLKQKTRIRLKAITKNDLELLRDWRNSVEIFPFNIQFTLLNMKNQLDWYSNLKNDSSRKMFMIIYNKTRIGVCGLIHIDSKIKHADIAIIIGKTNLQGKGIGTATLTKLLEYGFKKLNLNQIGAEVIEYNENSINLFSKLNFQLDAVFRDSFWRQNTWWDINNYSLLKNEFLKKN